MTSVTVFKSLIHWLWQVLLFTKSLIHWSWQVSLSSKSLTHWLWQVSLFISSRIHWPWQVSLFTKSLSHWSWHVSLLCRSRSGTGEWSRMNLDGRDWVGGNPVSRRSMQSDNTDLLQAWKAGASYSQGLPPGDLHFCVSRYIDNWVLTPSQPRRSYQGDWYTTTGKKKKKIPLDSFGA